MGFRVLVSIPLVREVEKRNAKAVGLRRNHLKQRPWTDERKPKPACPENQLLPLERCSPRLQVESSS